MALPEGGSESASATSHIRRAGNAAQAQLHFREEGGSLRGLRIGGASERY
jgi:hypothetical protein